MEKKLTYRLLYPGMRNIDLAKESGMIIHFLCAQYSYDTGVICYNNDDYSNTKLFVGGIKIDFIKRYFNNEVVDSICYLLRNARKIDILQIFHLSKKSVTLAAVYKLLNPKGFVYIKLDTDIRHLNNLMISKTFKGGLRKLFLKWVIDLVSSETKEVYNKVRNNWEDLSAKLIYLPNGVISSFKTCENKEKIILTVARIGSFEKATDVFLKAIECCELADWRIQIIGPVEPKFRCFLDQWLEKNRAIKESIDIIGPVFNRGELYSYYSKAAVFCLPSRWESFSFAMLEAAYHGCYLVVTPVGAAADILRITNYGRLVPIGDFRQLALALKEIITNWHFKKERVAKIHEEIEKRFNWDLICRDLDANIKKRIRGRR